MLDNKQDHPESDAENSPDNNSPSSGDKKKPTLRQRLANKLFQFPHRLNQSSGGYVPFVLWLLLLFGGIWFPAETVLNHVINNEAAPVGILFGTVAETPVDSDDTSADKVAATGARKEQSGESTVGKTTEDSTPAESKDNSSPKTAQTTDARVTAEAGKSTAIAENQAQNKQDENKDAASSSPKPQMSLKAAVILLIFCPLFWAWSNIALLCLMSSGMGEMNRAAEDTANGNEKSPDYRSACTRAFFVYLFVLLNELAMVGKLKTDDGGYARIAVLASLVAFVASYRPSFYQGLISKVSTAGVSGDNNQAAADQNKRPQVDDPNTGGDDEADQLQPVGAPDDEFGTPSPDDEKSLPASPR